MIGVTKFFDQPIFAAVQAPIHPHICQHLKLGWADGNTRYQYYDYGNLTFEEYMKLYIDYEYPEIEMLNKIKHLLENEKFEDANMAILQAIEKFADSPKLLNLNGQLKLMTGNIEEAIKLFSNIAERWPNNTDALNGLATCMIYQDDWHAGINLLLKILEMDPSNITAKENLKFMKNEISIFEQKS